jgi:RimJ/RimL family protein N-acetyltransferase
MAARNRLPPWHEHVRLANGREVLIRPIRPADAEPLQAGFLLLQPEEIRQRFLHVVKELTPEMTERLTHPDSKREFALVAAEPLPPGEAVIGAVARVAIADNGRDAEFAILVSRYIAGMGLGRHLMRRLVRWARGRKLDRLYGDVLEHNQAMLALAQSLGFHREPADTPGLARMVLDLKPPATSATDIAA